MVFLTTQTSQFSQATAEIHVAFASTANLFSQDGQFCIFFSVKRGEEHGGSFTIAILRLQEWCS